MGNSRMKDRYAIALNGRQTVALVVGATVLLGGVFVVGMNLGRRSIVAAAVIAAPKDPLARLDEPLPVRDDSVELKAHQALTDTRPIDKSLPVPQVKATTVSITPPLAPVVAPAVSPSREERVTPAAASLPPRTTRPEKSTAPAAAPARKGSWAIQVASLPKRSDAEKVAKKHKNRNARVVEANVPGKGHTYRVLLGSFETQDAAKRQLASLTRSGVKGIVTTAR